MADDASADDREPSGAGTPSRSGVRPRDPPEERLLDTVATNPLRSLAVAAAGVLVLAYAVLVAQQLLLAIWLLLTGFLVYLLVRFVRAHERLAGAAERLADDGE
ncbi:MAG: hypothetical protein ABEJ92_06720 [Halobacteriales archaeon]